MSDNNILSYTSQPEYDAPAQENTTLPDDASSQINAHDIIDEENVDNDVFIDDEEDTYNDASTEDEQLAPTLRIPAFRPKSATHLNDAHTEAIQQQEQHTSSGIQDDIDDISDIDDVLDELESTLKVAALPKTTPTISPTPSFAFSEVDVDEFVMLLLPAERQQKRTASNGNRGYRIPTMTTNHTEATSLYIEQSPTASNLDFSEVDVYSIDLPPVAPSFDYKKFSLLEAVLESNSTQDTIEISDESTTNPHNSTEIAIATDDIETPAPLNEFAEFIAGLTTSPDEVALPVEYVGDDGESEEVVSLHEDEVVTIHTDDASIGSILEEAENAPDNLDSLVRTDVSLPGLHSDDATTDANHQGLETELSATTIDQALPTENEVVDVANVAEESQPMPVESAVIGVADAVEEEQPALIAETPRTSLVDDIPATPIPSYLSYPIPHALQNTAVPASDPEALDTSVASNDVESATVPSSEAVDAPTSLSVLEPDVSSDSAALDIPVNEIKSADVLASDFDALDTPIPLSEEEPAVQTYEDKIVDTPVPLIDEEPVFTPRPRPRKLSWAASLRKRWRTLISVLLLIVLLVNAVLLWHDFTSVHLYLNALTTNGTLAGQEDLGSYTATTLLTSPVSTSTAAYVGVHEDRGQGTQQVLMLTGNATSWQATTVFSAPLPGGSLTTTSDGNLLVESTNGMQVITPGGQLLWQMQGAQPARGTHPFQPASDSTNVYTVFSANTGEIAAYNLHTGQVRWTQKLGDTLNYAPPLLLSSGTLYIASDSRLFALNSTNGTLKWSFPFIARTLLLADSSQGQLLLAAGPQGLLALHPTDGTQVWNFTGQMSNTLAPPQLYQATLTYQGTQRTPIVYTTGVVWQMPEAREQVWLYAVNALTGQALWSQPLASGFISADAGRTLMPLFDAGQVIISQQLSANQQRVSAFDALKGTPLWQTALNGSTRSAPTLLQTPDGTIVALTITQGMDTFSLPHLLMLFLLVLSLIGLPLIWFIPLNEGQQRWLYLQNQATHKMHEIIDILQHNMQVLRQQRLSVGTILAIVLPLVACISTLAYTQLNQPQQSLYQTSTATGSTLWHQVAQEPARILNADSQGNVLMTTTSDTTGTLHQLEVVDSNGTVLWKSFASEGTFAVPTLAAQSKTLLVTLSGPASLAYQYAPADPFYPPTLAHMLAFYSFDRQTGTLLWQHTAVYPGDQQSPVVLGADSNFIYIASLGTAHANAAMQLFAVNQATGTINWHIFGPTEATTRDNGTLLFHGRQVIWQVAGTIYAIDSTMGQIEWRHPFTQDTSALLAHEEQQMALSTNALLVMRSDGVHALDLASGNQLWTQAVRGQPTGLGVAAHTLFTYGNGQLTAYDLATHHQLWQQQSAPIQCLKVADDGSAVYIITTTPAVQAFDAQTGTTRWTLALPTQLTFTSSSSFFYSQGNLTIHTCLASSETNCASQRLLTIDTSTGTIIWSVDGQQIEHVALSQDGTSIIYSTMSSEWKSIMAHL